MLTIWGVMIITLFFTLLAKGPLFKVDSREFNGNYLGIPRILNPFHSLTMIILICYSGLRSSIGDTGYYMYSFKHLPNNLSDIFQQRDWGFSLFQYIIKNFFPHPQSLIIVTSIITIALILITLRKRSPNIIFTIFLFFVGGTYVSSMNGIRQYLVASVLFYASYMIFEEKKIKYILLVLIAATIHNSALIMIPIYFIVRQKAWTKKTVILLFGVLIIFFAFESFFALLLPTLEMTQYSHYINNILNDTNQGANSIRVIIALIPVILSYIYRKKLTIKLKYYDVYTNFSILNFITILFATYHWIFARLGMYFSLYNLILLPAVFYYCFNKNTKILMYSAAICLYLIYFYYDLQPHVYASYYLNINKDLIGPLTKSFYN